MGSISRHVSVAYFCVIITTSTCSGLNIIRKLSDWPVPRRKLILGNVVNRFVICYTPARRSRCCPSLSFNHATSQPPLPHSRKPTNQPRSSKFRNLASPAAQIVPVQMAQAWSQSVASLESVFAVLSAHDHPFVMVGTYALRWMGVQVLPGYVCIYSLS